MNEIEIRKATPAEAVWASEWAGQSEPWLTLGTTAAHFMTTFNHPEYELFVALHIGQPAGFMVLHPRGLASSPYIKSIAVKSEFQGKGIGAALLGFAEEHFRIASKHLFLCVSSFNTRARSFYSRHGFEQVGELKDFSVEGESEIILHKRIR